MAVGGEELDGMADEQTHCVEGGFFFSIWCLYLPDRRKNWGAAVVVCGVALYIIVYCSCSVVRCAESDQTTTATTTTTTTKSNYHVEIL